MYSALEAWSLEPGSCSGKFGECSVTSLEIYIVFCRPNENEIFGGGQKKFAESRSLQNLWSLEAVILANP